MKTLRPLAFFLLLAVATPRLAAQSTPAAPVPPESTAPAAAVAEEVYVPERTPAPAPADAAVTSPAASTATDPAAAAKSSAAASALPALTASPAPGAKLPAPPPLSPRFKQVRERIDTLFRHRNETPPVLDPRKNPFRPAGAAPVAVVPPVPGRPNAPIAGPAASNTDVALLQQAGATLKVAGTIQIGGVAHLIINQVPYKVGDVIATKVKGQPVFVRVKNISRYSYTLSLNQAELSLKY